MTPRKRIIPSLKKIIIDRKRIIKMKKYRVIPFLALASMSLTSCGFFNFFNNTTLEKKNVTVYETYDWEEGDINLEDSKIKDIDIKYLKDQELIPYITLQDYFSLFPSRI